VEKRVEERKKKAEVEKERHRHVERKTKKKCLFKTISIPQK
jgi:hypothetical protein